jgi:hypothetical protein
MSDWYHTCKKKKERIVGDLPPLDCEHYPQLKKLDELI